MHLVSFDAALRSVGDGRAQVALRHAVRIGDEDSECAITCMYVALQNIGLPEIRVLFRLVSKSCVVSITNRVAALAQNQF